MGMFPAYAIDNDELIDTCWDVNSGTAVIESGLLLELIDTCWDVNMPLSPDIA